MPDTANAGGNVGPEHNADVLRGPLNGRYRMESGRDADIVKATRMTLFGHAADSADCYRLRRTRNRVGNVG